MNLDDFERCITFAEQHPPPVAGPVVDAATTPGLNPADDLPRQYGAPRV